MPLRSSCVVKRSADGDGSSRAGISIVAACFLGNIGKYMDDHIAVVM